MRNPGGQLLICDDEGREKAFDSFTCGHCNRVSFVKPRQDPADIGGLCKTCMKLICGACVGEPCRTLEQRIAEEEARYEARRSYGF